MQTLRLAALAALGSAVLLAGCATGPYYDSGYYGGGYGYDSYYDGPYYESYPGYFGPSVGLGLGYNYYDRDERHGWHDNDNHWRGRDNNWQGRGNNWHGRDNDRRGRDDNTWRDEARHNPRLEQDRNGNPIGDGQQDRAGRPERVEQHDQRG